MALVAKGGSIGLTQEAPPCDGASDDETLRSTPRGKNSVPRLEGAVHCLRNRLYLRLRLLRLSYGSRFGFRVRLDRSYVDILIVILVIRVTVVKAE